MGIKVGKVGMIPITSIELADDRAREVMGDLEGLRDSMLESGLISPLAVKEIGDGKYKLLAGERRYTVLLANQVTEIPARIYEEDLSDLEMKIIEKSENFYRKDMEYWEFDKLTREIHEMQQSLHGVKADGPGEGWGMGDTAEMLGKASKASISTAIKRDVARQAFPEMFENCKTAADASKVLKKIDETIVSQAIAQKLESSKSNVTLQQLSKCYIVRDFFEGVKEIPDGIMHLVEIDPPYAIDLMKKKDSRAEGEGHYLSDNYNEVDKKDYPTFLSNLFSECYRVMAPHSWLICWFAPEPWFMDVYSTLLKIGFNTTRMCGIWTGKKTGQNLRPAERLTNSYEMFFYAWKGNPALNKAGRSNEFNFPPIPPQQKVHPTERPIELMQEVYSTFAFQGSRILIPFLGSGNGLIAAHNLGMSAVGFELTKAYKDSFLIKVNKLSGGI